MTSEERFAQIEHITAGITEERRKDREEYKALWRDAQRQINELRTSVLQLSEESRAGEKRSIEADKRLEQRIQQLADESREANKLLEERIASLVSGFGQFISQQPPR